ncbi:MAG: FliM/FliN family flagellar motor switch protein [Armatimonadota bacterium]
MLIEHCGKAELFRPPPVERLTERERGRLRTTLTRVVDSWRGAAEIGLRPGEMHSGGDAECCSDRTDELWFRAGGTTVVLGLTPHAAISLLCVNLGAKMPEAPEPALSAVDLALIDAWAARALPALVSALNAGPCGEIRRGPGSEALGQGATVTAGLTFAGEMAAGRIIIGSEIARHDGETAGGTLGDYPDLVMHTRLTVQATIVAEAVPIPELLELECGDVLLLGDKKAVEAELRAGDSVVAAGRPGAREGVRALRIKGAVLNDREDRLGATSDGF